MLASVPAHRVIQDLKVEFFRRDLTQLQISEATGMSQSKISRRLNGEVAPTVDELGALAAAAGFDLQIELIALAEGGEER